MATDTTQDTIQRTSRQQVLQAIRDLHAANRQPSRHTISEVLGVKLSIVDEHIKNLKDEGLIIPVIRGIFEPVDTRPDRAVSGTWTEDELGRTVYKLEVGDHCLDLSPREIRHVALLTGGVLAVWR